MTDSNEKRALLVLGPHRSGTSALTRGLACTGWSLGNTLIPPNRDNPKGFFENARIIDFNDNLMNRFGLCWDCLNPTMPERFSSVEGGYSKETVLQLLQDEFGDANNIILKDPRFCILAPLWHEFLSSAGYQAGYVLTTRHPLEAAKSQMARHQVAPNEHFVGTSLAEGVQLWAIYLKGALNFLSRHAGIIIDFADLLAAPRKVLSRAETQLSIRTPREAVDDYVVNFLSNELHHHNPEESAEMTAIQPYLEFYQSISGLESGSVLGQKTALGLYQKLDNILKTDSTVYENLGRAYAKARTTALKESTTITGLENELEKAHNIIQYNEYLIRTLQSEETR